jgi:hypothetical protein
MSCPFLSRALRRALLLSLATPPLSGCGGNVVVDGNGGATTTSTSTATLPSGSTSTSTEPGSTTSETGPTTDTKCALLSTAPLNPVDPCLWAFAIVGTPADCGLPEGGFLTLSECLALCPPNEQGMSVFQCKVEPVAAGNPGGATLFCEYADIPCGSGRVPPRH